MNKINHNKTIRTDQKFSVSMVIIAFAILLIGSTSTMVMARHHDSSTDNSGGTSDNSSSSTNNNNNQGTTSQGQSGYSITVNVNTHGFGKDRVNIGVTTENGYSANQEVLTAGEASWTFNIPPNQGNSIQVCVGQGLIGANCQKFTASGGDISVSMGASGLG